jgi:hypothetical protein
MSELFESMGREQPKPETPSARDQRRQRVVGEMRRRHVELVHERARATNVRRLARVALVAAAVAFTGVAFAGLGGVGPWRSPRSPHPPEAVAVSPAKAPAGPEPSADSAAKSDAAATPSEPLPALAAPVRSVDVAITPAAHPAPKGSSRREAVSNLEAVNRLFSEAKQARREGRDRQALAALDELLREYPHSVLAQEASVERFRVLSRLGRASEAQREANSYLERYPVGFARDEARRLVVGSSPP